MPDPVRVEMSGEATAVVQAGSIVGGVHVHARHAAPSPARPITEWHPFDLDEDELAIKLAISATAAESLVHVLVSKGKRAQAIRLLRDVFSEPNERLPFRRQVVLADLLADEGRWAEALELAKGKHWAREWVPERLALAGNLDKLRTLADAGVGDASRELAGLLAERGRYGELLDRTRKGDEHCAQRLVALAHDGKVPNGERLLAEGL